MTERVCRECGITDTQAEGGLILFGDPICWADDDLCSWCQEHSLKQLEQDAARYRFLRNRQTRQVDFAAGGLFAGRVPEGLILGGEDLDRAIDTELGLEVPVVEPLEKRLATCLADVVDTALLSLKDEVGGFRSPLEIRLGHFRPEVAEHAAELLEEAGL